MRSHFFANILKSVRRLQVKEGEKVPLLGSEMHNLSTPKDEIGIGEPGDAAGLDIVGMSVTVPKTSRFTSATPLHFWFACRMSVPFTSHRVVFDTLKILAFSPISRH